MRVLVWLLLIALFVVGCEPPSDSRTPGELRSAARPVVIVALNDEGVILRDADGEIYTYNEGSYFAQILMKSDCESGDELIPKEAGKHER